MTMSRVTMKLIVDGESVEISRIVYSDRHEFHPDDDDRPTVPIANMATFMLQQALDTLSE